MSELEHARDHARMMAQRLHGADCPINRTCGGPLVSAGMAMLWMRCRNKNPHVTHVTADGFGCPGVPDPSACDGCMPAKERALWAQIADEIDAYLAPAEDGSGLFGEDA